MRLLLVCPHFTPDLHAATGEVMTQLVESLAEFDYETTVVTSLPWYKQHRVEEQWRGRPWRTEKTDWGRVTRVWPFPSDKSNISARALGFVGFTGLAATRGLFAGKHDVVMGMSPPVFVGDAAYVASLRSRAPFVFNTQDIFPDVAIELGALNGERVISLAKRYERSLYRRADAVTVLSEDQAVNVRKKLAADKKAKTGSAQKVHVIKNFVDLNKVKPTQRDGAYRVRNFLLDKTVVMYSGNVGLSQSFDLIRSAAIKSSDDPNVVFVINGEGAARPEVDRWASEMHNVITVDFGPREQISEILGAADLHLILLKKGLAQSSTPSKLYGILAAERPVLASIDEGSEVAKIVSKAKAGLVVPPDDPDAFLTALTSLLRNRERLEQMGKNARLYAAECLNPKRQAESYDALFRSLVKG